MPWPTKREGAAGRTALLGVFLAYTLVIGLIERQLPLSLSLPGLRLGLANVGILLALYMLPFSQALLLLILKCLLNAIFAGSPAALLYSLSGSLLSFGVMGALLALCKDKLSPVGISVAGAAFHNIGQILMACLLLDSLAILWYLPPLLLIGLISGTLTGILVGKLRLLLGR